MAEAARVAAHTPQPLSLEDARMVAALRAGDERAFALLVESLGPSLKRLARTLVPAAFVDEVVQDAWLGVINGIDRFEGRSSLKTWVFRIVANRAKTRAIREARTVPFSSFAPDDEGPSVDPSRFLPDGRYAHHWATPPQSWNAPEDRLLAAETLDVVKEAIAALPPAQRAVIALRDVDGWTSAEVCEALDLSEGNQRVLLHRARTRVRAALDAHLGPHAADYARDRRDNLAASS